MSTNGKRTFAVWETEYVDEGSNLYEAYSESGARRMWRHETRTTGPVSEQPPLSVAEMTPELMRERRSFARRERNARAEQ